MELQPILFAMQILLKSEVIVEVVMEGQYAVEQVQMEAPLLSKDPLSKQMFKSYLIHFRMFLLQEPFLTILHRRYPMAIYHVMDLPFHVQPILYYLP